MKRRDLWRMDVGAGIALREQLLALCQYHLEEALKEAVGRGRAPVALSLRATWAQQAEGALESVECSMLVAIHDTVRAEPRLRIALAALRASAASWQEANNQDRPMVAKRHRTATILAAKDALRALERVRTMVKIEDLSPKKKRKS